MTPPPQSLGTLVRFIIPSPADLTAEERAHNDATGEWPVRVEVVATADTAVAVARRLTTPREREVREFMTVAEYAKYRRVPVTSVRRWCRLPANRLPADIIGPRLIEARVKEADEWIASGGPEWAIRCSAAAAVSREQR